MQFLTIGQLTQLTFSYIQEKVQTINWLSIYKRVHQCLKTIVPVLIRIKFTSMLLITE